MNWLKWKRGHIDLAVCILVDSPPVKYSLFGATRRGRNAYCSKISRNELVRQWSAKFLLIPLAFSPLADENTIGDSRVRWPRGQTGTAQPDHESFFYWCSNLGGESTHQCRTDVYEISFRLAGRSFLLIYFYAWDFRVLWLIQDLLGLYDNSNVANSPQSPSTAIPPSSPLYPPTINRGARRPVQDTSTSSSGKPWFIFKQTGKSEDA